MMATSSVAVSETVTRWRTWAAQAFVHASRLEQQGERFDAQLKRARASVRAQAADILRSTPDLAKAGDEMIRYAIRYSVRIAPLIGFDEAAVKYTRARTWQACAWELDPDLPVVQPRWSDG